MYLPRDITCIYTCLYGDKCPRLSKHGPRLGKRVLRLGKRGPRLIDQAGAQIGQAWAQTRQAWVQIGREGAGIGQVGASGYPHIGPGHYYIMDSWLPGRSHCVRSSTLVRWNSPLHSHLSKFVVVSALFSFEYWKRCGCRLASLDFHVFSSVEVCGGSGFSLSCY